MDWNAIMTAIGSLGFPIIACCGMFYMYNQIITTLNDTLNKMDKTLSKILDKLDIKED